MTRRMTIIAVAAVAIGHLDVLMLIACTAAVCWVAAKRRQGVAA